MFCGMRGPSTGQRRPVRTFKVLCSEEANCDAAVTELKLRLELYVTVYVSVEECKGLSLCVRGMTWMFFERMCLQA